MTKRVLWVSIDKPTAQERMMLNCLFKNDGGIEIIHIPQYILCGRTISKMFVENNCDELVVDLPHHTISELTDPSICPVKPIIPFYTYVNLPGRIKNEKRFIYFERVKELKHTSELLL